MKNNSKLNTVLLIIIILLLVVVAYILIGNKSVLQKELFGNSADSMNSGQQSMISFLVSPKWGLKYPVGLTISEYYQTQNQTPTQTFTGNETAFAALKSSGNLLISWGDESCMPDGNQYGVFQYGVSIKACVKGRSAYAGLFDASKDLFQADKNLFGDFVLLNQ